MTITPLDPTYAVDYAGSTLKPCFSLDHPSCAQVKQKKIGVSTLNAKLAEHIDKIDTDLVREP